MEDSINDLIVPPIKSLLASYYSLNACNDSIYAPSPPTPIHWNIGNKICPVLKMMFTNCVFCRKRSKRESIKKRPLYTGDSPYHWYWLSKLPYSRILFKSIRWPDGRRRKGPHSKVKNWWYKSIFQVLWQNSNNQFL